MRNPVETLISTIAPHRCLICKREGSLLCQSCMSVELICPPSRCYRCHRASIQSQVCASCRPKSPLKHVWIATEYNETAKQLIHRLKFERASAAADNIAESIDEALPVLPADIVVCHIPTAHRRIRVRGYDQSMLIATSLAKRRGWTVKSLLLRKGSSRQVGSSRKERLHQLQNAFLANDSHSYQHVLLIDDVLTTGATVESAAKVIKKSGVKQVDAVVFAQPIE